MVFYQSTFPPRQSAERQKIETQPTDDMARILTCDPELGLPSPFALFPTTFSQWPSQRPDLSSVNQVLYVNYRIYLHSVALGVGLYSRHKAAVERRTDWTLATTSGDEASERHPHQSNRFPGSKLKSQGSNPHRNGRILHLGRNHHHVQAQGTPRLLPLLNRRPHRNRLRRL